MKTLPKPCKTKDLRDFVKKNPKKFPHKSSVLVGSLLFLPGNRTPPQTLQILGVAGRHATKPMLRGMLVC